MIFSYLIDLQKFTFDLQVLQVLQVVVFTFDGLVYFKLGVRADKNISWYKYFGVGIKAQQRANLVAYVRFIGILFAGIKKKQYFCGKP